MIEFANVKPAAAEVINPNNGNIANAAPSVRNTINDENVTGVRKKETNDVGECETCKNRRYQDVSNDPGVSFKSPTKLTPQQAATAVYSHEREHYSRENAKATQEGREVVSNTIRIHTSICPECGKPYVSGGETRTVTKGREDGENPQEDGAKVEFAKRFFDQTVGKHQAKIFDTKA